MEESVGFFLVESRNMSICFSSLSQGNVGFKSFFLLPGDPWKHVFKSKSDGTIYLPFEMEKNEICGDEIGECVNFCPLKQINHFFFLLCGVSWFF